MTYANINHVGSITLGEMLKIFSTNGVYNNLPDQSDLWKLILKKKVAAPEGKQVQYLLRKAYGQTASQFVAPGATGVFPMGQAAEHSEAVAYFKDFATTVDVPRHLLNKTGSQLAQYAMPLAEELNVKGIVTARNLSRSLCGDGTGAIGVISSASISGGKVVVVLSTTSANAGRSHVGNFQHGEIVKIASTAGAAQAATVSSGTVHGYKVYDVDVEADTVTLVPVEISGSSITELTATNVNTVGAADIIYPYGATLVDVSGSITDYGLASYSWAGLDSLLADDARVVNNLTMTGAISGSRIDAFGATIDKSHFQAVMSKIKRRAGKNKYKYNQALMFDTTYDAMLESWETDRMIVDANDTNRGSSKLGYKHGKDTLAFETDEFISKQRILILPEGDVLQYRGTDVSPVKVGGATEFMPNDSSGNHMRTVRSYLEGSGLLFCVHPAACGVIEDFAV
jgi:hypothetical protein